VSQAKNSLARLWLAELAGTYLLVLWGCGVSQIKVIGQLRRADSLRFSPA
jgi:hypothetical protein